MKAHEIKIDREFEKLIPPLSNSEEDQLEKNILAVEGPMKIRDKLIVWNGTLIDGHHRLEIAKRHGLEFEVEEKDFADRNEAILWIITNQFGRRNLAMIDRAALGEKMEAVLKIKAEENKAIGHKLGAAITNRSSANSPTSEIEKIDVREVVAAKVQMGSNTYSRAKVVLANSDPKQIEAIRDGNDSINRRFNEIMEVQHKVTEEKKALKRQEEREAEDLKEAKRLALSAEAAAEYRERKRKERAELEEKARLDMFANVAQKALYDAQVSLQKITDDNPFFNEVMDKMIAWCEKNKR